MATRTHGLAPRGTHSSTRRSSSRDSCAWPGRIEACCSSGERKVVQPNGQGNALNESSSARRSGRANARDPARRLGHQNDLSRGHGGTFVPLSQTCGRLSVVSAGRNVDCVWRWRLLR